MSASNSERLKHVVPDVDAFKSMLNDAVSNAKDTAEVDFSNKMQDNFDRYGAEMFISTKQLAWLERIATGSAG